jgi:dephospho-CoA kinase
VCQLGWAGILPAVTKRVGLTGGVASGKSTVGEIFTALGATVIDADVLAREVVAPGTDGLAEVVKAFGEDVLTASGELDRAKMGEIVFADQAKRKTLESIIHPRVRERGAELEKAARGPIVIHEIPLLVETGQATAFDALVVVDVPVEVQVERLVKDRGLTPEEAEARIAAQATREERLAVANYIIDNSGTPEQLRVRVAEVYAGLQASH